MNSAVAPGAVVFVTGVTAVGKTSVARELERRGVGKSLSIGELVLSEARHVWPNVTHNQLRQEPDLYAPPTVVESAILALCQRIEDERDTQTLIIESHAVTAESYGCRVTPFSYGHLQRLAFDFIVLLECSEAALASRWRDRHGGIPVPTSLGSMTKVQGAVGAAYAVAIGCPLYVITADAPIDFVASRVEKLLYQCTGSKAARQG